MYICASIGSDVGLKFSSRRKMFSILSQYLYHSNVGVWERAFRKTLLTTLSTTLENAYSKYRRDGNGHELEEKEFGMKGISCPPAPYERYQRVQLSILPPA